MNRIPPLLLYALLFSLNCIGQADFADKLNQPIRELPNASPASVGMNDDSIKNLIQLINTNPPNDFRGMVVIKDNKLVVEKYFNTYWRATVLDIRSAGKGVTSLLLGIALDKGLVRNIEQSIYDFFPGPKYLSPANDGHRDIKIRNLLSMSSGLSADDRDENSPGMMTNWITRADWVDFATTLPMLFKPGEKYVYNDVCPMLIGAIIEQASGQKLADFARENLFSPLGITEFYWYTAPNGHTVPMGNLYISTLDFAKIGLLVLNKGRWQGVKVVSENWVSEMVKERFDISKLDPFASGYGYFWFRGSKDINGRKIDYYYASGNGGNLCLVVPSENMVVSLTSSAYGQGYAHYRSLNIFAYLLKSLVK